MPAQLPIAATIPQLTVPTQSLVQGTVTDPSALAPSLSLSSIPGGSLIQLISGIYNYYLPAINYFLSQHGFVRLPTGMPASEQFALIAGHLRSMSGLKATLDKEERDLANHIRGFFQAQGVPHEKLVPGTPAGNQIEQISKIIVGYYPTLYLLAPSIVTLLNPRSAYPLAYHLSRVFARNAPLASPEEVGRWASQAADLILTDGRMHQGLTSAQIAEVAEAASRAGLLRFDRNNPEEFAKSLAGVIKLVAPIREQYALRGEPFNAAEAVDLIQRFIHKYPTATDEELALEFRREMALQRRGGEYRLLGLKEESQPFIRRSGVPIEVLEQQHQQLKQKAAESLLGSALGAVARAVRTGMVSKNSPAGRLYEKANRGEPLGIRHPQQIFSILAESGVHPQTAATMILYGEESTYWLTPAMINSLRVSQFDMDWGPRFEAVYRAVPKDDPESAALREAILSRLVRQAGYKNIHHFLALHGEALNSIPQLRELALREAHMGQELAGYEDVTWGGLARLAARLQDIGAGKRGDKLTLGDLMGPVAQMYKIPEPELKEYGMNPPDKEPARHNYMARTQASVEKVQAGEPVPVPEAKGTMSDYLKRKEGK